jgi:hypothetical protein
LREEVAAARAVVNARLTKAATLRMSAAAAGTRGRGRKWNGNGAPAHASAFFILADDEEAEAETEEGQRIVSSNARIVKLQSEADTYTRVINQIDHVCERDWVWSMRVVSNANLSESMSALEQEIGGSVPLQAVYEAVDAYKRAADAYDVAAWTEAARIDCRFHVFVNSSSSPSSSAPIPPACIYCRDLTTPQDIQAAWSTIRALYYVDIPVLLPVMVKKLWACITPVLKDWVNAPTCERDAKVRLHRWQLIDVILECFGCVKTDQSTALETGSAAAAAPPAATAAAATEPRVVALVGASTIFKSVEFEAYHCLYGTETASPLIQTVAERSIAHRRRTLVTIFQLSTGMDKNALHVLVRGLNFPLLHMCDLVECAFMQGYSITGKDASKDDAILVEPYWSVLSNVLRNVLLPLKHDSDAQVRRFEQISLRYRQLLLTYKRTDLMGVFGIAHEHMMHFKEAPTLQKCFAWRRAGADLEVPDLSAEASAQPAIGFQVETRTIEQIQRDQLAKHQAQQAERLKAKLAEKKLLARGAAKGKSVSTAATELSRKAPSHVVKSFLPAASKLTGAQNSSTSTSIQQQLRAAEKQLAEFDSRLDLMGNEVAGYFKGKQVHVRGEDGARLTQTRKRLQQAVQQLERQISEERSKRQYADDARFAYYANVRGMEYHWLREQQCAREMEEN